MLHDKSSTNNLMQAKKSIETLAFVLYYDYDSQEICESLFGIA